MLIYRKQGYKNNSFLIFWFWISIIIMSFNLPNNFWDFKFIDIVNLAVIIIGALFAILKVFPWAYNKYLLTYPFIIEFQKQRYNNEFVKQNLFSGTIAIKGVHSLFPSSITLRIKTRRLKIFEQVNIKFQEKRWFKKSRLWYWIDTPKDIIFIEEIIDLGIRNTQIQYNKTHISDRHKTSHPKYDIKTLLNGKGGIDVQYNPPYDCPKGESLSLKIKLDIKVKKKWKGRIIFKHIRGDSYQGCVKLPVKIIHTDN